MSLAPTSPTSGFFVAGGTVPPGSPSYVERSADRELYEALLAGEYCYVLNSRQMGKSSLAVRTIARLREAGVRTAFVDLTRIGGANVSAEQWYAGLLAETGRVLELRKEAVAYLREHREIGGGQRYLSFLHEAALPASDAPLVVMFDEIDAVRSLGFSTDELFAGVRQLHNGRSSEPALRNLTFCLLGAALPSDLIRDPRTTPFNVGRRIELRDFTRDEARAFSEGLGSPSPLVGGGERLVDRVLFWTGGHPFLTQTLCAALAAGETSPSPQPSPARGEGAGRVDSLVRERYLDARARETDTNLADVGNRLLGRGDPNVDDAARADALSLYAKLLKGGVPDDESNLSCARVKMSGVARLEGGQLKIRNRIYGEVFGPAWIRENMPGQELRRQRKAFWKGALRTGAVATAVVLAIGALAWNNYRLMRQAQYDAYVASMRTLPLSLAENNLEAIDATLASLKDNPARGWEWDYWSRIAHREDRFIPVGGDFGNSAMATDPSGRLAAVASDREIAIIDFAAGRIVRRIPSHGDAKCVWLRDGRRVLAISETGWIGLVDAETGAVLREGQSKSIAMVGARFVTSADDRFAYAADAKNRHLIQIDLTTMRIQTLRVTVPGEIRFLQGVADGERLILFVRRQDQTPGLVVYKVRGWTSKEIPLPPASSALYSLAITPTGTIAAYSAADGRVILIDLATGHMSPSLPAAKEAANVVEFSPDGTKLVTIDLAREARVFRVVGTDRLEPIASFRDAMDGAFLGDGGRIALRYTNVRVYPIDGSGETPTFHRPQSRATNVYADGTLYSAAPGRMEIDDLRTGRSLKRIALPANARLFQTDAFGPHVAIWDGREGYLLETSTGRRIFDLPPSYDPLPANFGETSFAVSPDGRAVALREAHAQVSIWDVATGKRRFSLSVTGGASEMRFSPDSRSLAIGAWKGDIWALRATDGVPLGPHVSSKFRASVFSIAFAPDGKRLASASNDDQGAVWEIATGKKLCDLVGHSQAPQCIAWSPDGRRVVTGSWDRTVRMWDPETGQELGIIGRHDTAVTSVEFLPGGRTVASVGSDGVAKLWMTEARP